MKKFMLGILVGAILFVPATVWADHQGHLDGAKPIYTVNGEATVSVFDDQDNKCYVALYNFGQLKNPAISCVKR